MFYKNRKSLIFNVMSSVFYCFIEKYVCVNYLGLKIEENFYSLHRVFEDNSSDELSGIFRPDILLYIVYCYIFIQDEN